MSFDWKIMKSELKMICWSLDFVFKAGNVSRTQELLKKKTPKNIFSFCQYCTFLNTLFSNSQKEIFVRYQERPQHLKFKVILNIVLWRETLSVAEDLSVREQRGTHVYYNQHAMFPCQEFSLSMPENNFNAENML